MGPALRKTSYFAFAVFTLVYAYVVLGGPQGIPALRAKWDEVRQLETENAVIKQDNDRRRHRIEDLMRSREALELEIRRNTGKVKKGETTYILPEGEKKTEP